MRIDFIINFKIYFFNPHDCFSKLTRCEKEFETAVHNFIYKLYKYIYLDINHVDLTFKSNDPLHSVNFTEMVKLYVLLSVLVTFVVNPHFK